MDFNEVWFSPSRNEEEEKNDISTGCIIFNVGSNPLIFAKIDFF